jgi:hypothetical protein
LLAAAVALGSILVVGPESAIAKQPNGNHHAKGHHVSGAPGPIAGAGLPVLAIGFGIYWLIKRRKAQ